MVADAVASENKKRGVATGVKTMYNNHRKSTRRRNDLNYYEYLDQLQKKYGTTNTELLEELAASGTDRLSFVAAEAFMPNAAMVIAETASAITVSFLIFLPSMLEINE